MQSRAFLLLTLTVFIVTADHGLRAARQTEGRMDVDETAAIASEFINGFLDAMGTGDVEKIKPFFNMMGEYAAGNCSLPKRDMGELAEAFASADGFRFYDIAFEKKKNPHFIRIEFSRVENFLGIKSMYWDISDHPEKSLPDLADRKIEVQRRKWKLMSGQMFC